MTLRCVNLFFFAVLALGELFFHSNSVNAFSHSKEGRELQQTCPVRNDDPQGSIRNIIVSTRLFSANINRVELEVIYDIDVDFGTLGSFPYVIFDQDFGEFGGFSLEEEVDFPESNTTNFFALNPVIGLRNEVSVTVCYSEPTQDSSAVFRFQANDNVCLHSNGRQALAASWLSETTNSVVDFVEVDWSVPLTAGTPPDLGIDDLDFEPATDNFFIDLESEPGRLNLFLRYNEADLNIRSGDNRDIFFFLPVAFFNNDDLEACTEFAAPSNLFTIVLATIPALACVCLVGLAIGQRYYDRREAERFRRVRNNNQNLRYFPGNQDIVLLPNQGNNENGDATVQAVLEEEDAPELDDILPTTTINVRLQSSQSQTERD